MRANARHADLLSTFTREKRVGRDDRKVVVDTGKLKAELEGMSRSEKLQLKRSLEQGLQGEGLSGGGRISRGDDFATDSKREQLETLLELVNEQISQSPGGGVVSQLNPDGAKRSRYQHGEIKCAAAAVATLARQNGMFKNMTDAELVDGLAKGKTGKRGTSGVGVMQMLREARMPLAGAPYVGSFEPSALREHLRNGNKLVAQVGIKDDQGRTSGHFVTISGMKGPNFLVQDPMTGKTHEWTPQALQRAVKDAPGVGMIIPVGKPGPNAVKSDRLAEAPSFVPKDKTVNEYANWVGEMLQSTHPGSMARGSMLYQSLLQSSNERDQRAAQLIYKRVIKHIDLGQGPARTTANDVLGQMRSNDASVRNQGTARFRQLLRSQDPADQHAARIIFRHVMVREPGGGYNRRAGSFGSSAE